MNLCGGERVNELERASDGAGVCVRENACERAGLFEVRDMRVGEVSALIFLRVVCCVMHTRILCAA